MKKNIILYGFFCFNIFLSFPLANAREPYRLVIVAGEHTNKQVREFIETYKNTEPFQSLGSQIRVTIVPTSDSTMKCAQGRDVERLITCDENAIATIGVTYHANKIIAITHAAAGGSGSSGGIALVGKDSPPDTGIHELGHTYDLDDEYDYNTFDSKVYCPNRKIEEGESPNTVCFKPDFSPFESDSQARRSHMQQIPWSSQINTPTPITHSNILGTDPQGNYDGAGLYQGGGCGIDSDGAPCWRPFYRSIMREHFYGKIEMPYFYRRQILLKMEAEVGHPLDEQFLGNGEIQVEKIDSIKTTSGPKEIEKSDTQPAS